MNWRFFTKEAFRALSRNAAPSIAALVTVMITTMVLGVFIPASDATTGAANEIRGRLVVQVFLHDAASGPDTVALRQRLEGDARVKSVTYVSKEEARESLKGELRRAAELLGKENPLPASFRVTPKDPAQVGEIAASLARVDSKGKTDGYVSPAIESVKDGEDQSDKILSVTGAVKWSLWAFAILLMLASTVLVANTIRLSIYARRREIEVMRMVGATGWFIRWPFVIEGLLVGAAGGTIAVLLLLIAKQTIVDPLADQFALFAAPDTISFLPLAIMLLVAAMAISAAGSGFTLRRFLRI